MREEGEQSLRMAQAESERVLGGLAARREAMVADMVVIKDRVNGLMEQLESTIALSKTQDVLDLSMHQAEPADLDGQDPARDDLLGLPEGFDLVLPDILPVDEEE